MYCLTIDNKDMKYIKLLASILLIFVITSCSKEDNQYVEIASIEINEPDLVLGWYGTKQLHVNIEPANASDQEITWTSSNADIAVVSILGFVRCKKKRGVTIITAKSSNGKISERRIDVIRWHVNP